MNLLLTHGYFLAEDPLEQEIMKPYVPLGILYIAAHLESTGLAVDVFDSTFRSFDDFERFVAEERPPIIGFYCNLMTRKTVIKMVEVARRFGSTVVVGGPEPASYVEEYLAHGADVVVHGEGELTLEELVPHLEAHGLTDLAQIHGISYRSAGGESVTTAARDQIVDLDAQPLPARDKVDLQRYVDVWREAHGKGSVSLITARGCPYRCNWCSHGVYGHTHRRRSPEQVADELEGLMARYRPDMVWYADDVFTIHHGWLRKYAAELERRGLKVPFETISREDRLNEEIIELLASMGCFRLWVGSESGSQRVLDAMDRRTDAGRVRQLVKQLQHHGIEAGLFIMLGYDGEEEEDLHATVRHLKSAVPDQFLTTVSYPIKGTGYYQRVADRLKPTRPWAQSSDREVSVVGRRSARYYRHATRWMVNEVALQRHLRRPAPALHRAAKCFVSSKLGRLGMWLARHEFESAEKAS